MHRPPTTNYPPPQPFLLSLLPLILSPDPIPIPPLLLSDPARQAIHYLGLKAEDAAYWTTGTRDEAVVDKRRELIEAGNTDDLILGDPHYHCDLEETKCIIPISLPSSSRGEDESLGVVLLWEDELPPLSATAAEAAADKAAATEEEDDTRPGWTFLELQSLSQKPAEMEVVSANGRRRPSWYPTLKEAIHATAFQPAFSLPSHLLRRDSPPELLEFQRNSPLLGSRNSPPHPPTDPRSVVPSFGPPLTEDEEEEQQPYDGEGGGKKRKKTAAEMEDGNGAATPGAYGTAEDFWDGWSEDEDGGAEGSVGGGAGVTADEEDDDAGYWDSYGREESQIGDDHGEEDERAVEATPRLQQQGPVTPPSPAKSIPHRDRSATITPHTPGAVVSPPLSGTASPALNGPSAPSSPPQPPPAFASLAPPSSSHPNDQLYFSSNLPPLSPRHFGISPTQPDPERFLTFTSPTASIYSTNAPRIGEDGGEGESSFSSLPPDTPQVSQQNGASGGGLVRRSSDTSKALPAHPLSPIKSNTVSSTTAQPAAAFPTRPSPIRQGTLSPSLGPTKALPPAPSQIALAPPLLSSQSSPPKQQQQQVTGTSPSPSSSTNKTRKAPPAPLSPSAFSSSTGGAAHTSAIPLSPRSPRAPPGGETDKEKPTPPRPGSTYFPLRSPTSSTFSTAHAPAPAPAARGDSDASSLTAPPPLELRQRGRFGSLDSFATSTTTGGALTETEGAQGDGSVHGLNLEEHVSPTSTSEEEQEKAQKEEDDALRFALAGAWALFVKGAKTTEEREERRRRWERVGGEVVRS